MIAYLFDNCTQFCIMIITENKLKSTLIFCCLGLGYDAKLLSKADKRLPQVLFYLDSDIVFHN